MGTGGAHDARAARSLQKTETSTRSHFRMARNPVEHDCYGSFGRLRRCGRSGNICVLNTQRFAGLMTRRTWLGSPLAALGLAREATSLSDKMNLKAHHAWGRMFNARSRTQGLPGTSTSRALYVQLLTLSLRSSRHCLISRWSLRQSWGRESRSTS